jgi:hypothetical protein
MDTRNKHKHCKDVNAAFKSFSMPQLSQQLRSPPLMCSTIEDENLQTSTPFIFLGGFKIQVAMNCFDLCLDVHLAQQFETGPYMTADIQHYSITIIIIISSSRSSSIIITVTITRDHEPRRAPNSRSPSKKHLKTPGLHPGLLRHQEPAMKSHTWTWMRAIS